MSKGLVLTIGNKNYSSWSLCAWLCLKAADLDFTINKILLGVSGSRKKIKSHSPSGFVPSLDTQTIVISDSLAIMEYVNELSNNALLPSDINQRAKCRSIIAELHSGFKNLRTEIPLNISKVFNNIELSNNATWQLKRIIEILNNRPKNKFLFGEWSAADIFYSQICIRLINYNLNIPDNIRAYAQKVLNHPHMQEWIKDAKSENERIEIIDSLQKK